MLQGSDIRDVTAATTHEWLIANGVGGFAAGTASGVPGRRSHVVFAAAFPGGRPVALVSRFEERMTLAGTPFELSAACFTDGRVRDGAAGALESFSCEPWPLWRWRFDGVVLERAWRVIPGHHALLASWRLIEGRDVRLSVAPLLVARPPLAPACDTREFKGAVQGIPGRVRIETLPGLPLVTLWHNGTFMPGRGFSRGLDTPLERDGAPFEPAHESAGEDAFLPGWVQGHLESPGRALHVVISTEDSLFRALATEERLGTPPARTLNDCIAALDDGARERRATWLGRTIAGADLTARQAASSHGGEGESLARRADALIAPSDALAATLAAGLGDSLVRRHGRTTLVSAWPGGEERGVDALRAASALVSLRAFEPARAIARGYLEYLDEGLAPEHFDLDDGLPRYGGPGPSLWLVHLVDLLARRAHGTPGQDSFLRDEAWPALEGVLHHLRAGARFGVHCDSDGLLWQGEGAEARAEAGTNALWYHALVAMAQMGKLLGRRENAAFYLAWAHDLQRRYTATFWDDDAGGLFEARTAAGSVRGVSPAQLWAVALPPALLPPPLAGRLLRTLERELDARPAWRERPDEPATSLAWLGPWAAAVLRTHGRAGAEAARVRARFAHLADEVRTRGGLPVTGSRAQHDTLAVAEILRAWIEEIPRESASVNSTERAFASR